MSEDKKAKTSGNFMTTFAGFIVDKRNLIFLVLMIGIIFSVFSSGWVEVENNLLDAQNDSIQIAVGALTGSKYLVGSGPKIPLKIIPIGNVTTELKTEFESKGINQTIYRIYLELDCDIKILTPYENMEHKIENQVLLVETVIVGGIPQTYYNLEGLTEDDSMEFIAN